MEKRIDELEGRLAAINDKLSGVVKQFNDDKQKCKDETEFVFAQHKLVVREVVEGARKYSWTACRDCEHGDQPSTTSCTPGKQFIRSIDQ